jgi:predicted RND superfamily exporter protein
MSMFAFVAIGFNFTMVKKNYNLKLNEIVVTSPNSDLVTKINNLDKSRTLEEYASALDDINDNYPNFLSLPKGLSAIEKLISIKPFVKEDENIKNIYFDVKNSGVLTDEQKKTIYLTILELDDSAEKNIAIAMLNN